MDCHIIINTWSCKFPARSITSDSGLGAGAAEPHLRTQSGPDPIIKLEPTQTTLLEPESVGPRSASEPIRLLRKPQNLEPKKPSPLAFEPTQTEAHLFAPAPVDDKMYRLSLVQEKEGKPIIVSL